MLEPLDLAQRMAAGQDLYLVDLRDPAECARGTLPGATCLAPDDPTARSLADLAPTRPLVLVDGAVDAALPAGVWRYGGTVVRLDGGVAAFAKAVVDAPVPPTEATPSAWPTIGCASRCTAGSPARRRRSPSPAQGRPEGARHQEGRRLLSRRQSARPPICPRDETRTDAAAPRRSGPSRGPTERR
ncbi:MAG: rhodanese-like domain-containing protein [Myxococcota bacterium]